VATAARPARPDGCHGLHALPGAVAHRGELRRRAGSRSLHALPSRGRRQGGQHVSSELHERNRPSECTSDLNLPSRAFTLPSARQGQAGCTRERVVRCVRGFPSGDVFWLGVCCGPRGVRLRRSCRHRAGAEPGGCRAERSNQPSRLRSRAELRCSLLSWVALLPPGAEVDHLHAESRGELPSPVVRLSRAELAVWLQPRKPRAPFCRAL